MESFFAKIGLINGNPYVIPPKRVRRAIFKLAKKDKGPIPVRGTINGAPFQQTLVRYLGEWRLYTNLIMLKAAGDLWIGDMARFKLTFDTKPRSYPMLPWFRAALAKNPTAKKNWQRLIPSRQKEILRYLSWLKSPEARSRNVQRAIKVLSGSQQRFMARSWSRGQ